MDEAVAVIAAHLGIVNEEEINNMSIPFFNDVLAALGRRLNYESISNLYGNSLCKDASKYIQDANPLLKQKAIGNSFANIIGAAAIVKADNAKDALTAKFGDVSWADGVV